MLIKYKHKLKKKSNHIILRLQRKGFLSYPVYSLIIVHKKSREGKGKYLDKIGSYILILMKDFFSLIVIIILLNGKRYFYTL